MVQGLEPCGDAAAVAFEAELAFQGPDDGLDALAGLPAARVSVRCPP